MSYNVEGFYHATQLDDGTNSLVNYIIEQDADIVCLQESNNDHDARRTKINKQLDKHYPYLAKKWATKNGVSELRCYSKFPIIASEVIEVESFGNGAMACEIVINEDTILVVNNPLRSEERRVGKEC